MTDERLGEGRAPAWDWVGLHKTLPFVLVGVLLLWLASSSLLSGYPVLVTMVATLGSVLLISGPGAWLGAHTARVELGKSLLGTTEFVESIRQAGVHDLSHWQLELPDECNSIDILVIRSRHWTGGQIAKIQSLLREGCHLRVCLAHPESKMIAAWAEHFTETEDEVRRKIRETIYDLARAATEMHERSDLGHLEIRAHRFVPGYTYYRFGQDIHALWYRTMPGRADLPILSLRNGWLGDFFREDFEAVWARADRVFDSFTSFEDNAESLSAAGLAEDKLTAISNAR